MLKALYERVMRLASSPHAGFALFAIAFAESSFFPVPPDVMLAPMVLARPERTWRFAAICTAGSVIGGVLGYAIGYTLEPVGHAILDWTGGAGFEAVFKRNFDKYGIFFILGQGLVPLPYKLLTITTGLFHFNLPEFIAASCLTRSLRFFGVAALVRRFGPGLMAVIERRLLLVSCLLVASLVVTLVVLHLLNRHIGEL
jgi:membrane protein YqaA with SNARE-associated domain